MAGTTYSRTSGHAILPGTWDYIRSRSDIPDAQRLAPSDRYNYDTVSAGEREAFIRLALQELTTPPDFLKFALAAGTDSLTPYPGEADVSAGKPADGSIAGFTQTAAAAQLGISVDQLQIELAKFSGPVSLVFLVPGQKLYRSVGLTAQATTYSSVTNALLGNYWEESCPSNYADEAQWRSATAVLAEWNGDYGYIEAELAKPIAALIGVVGMQKLARQGNSVLAGGAKQVYVPRLTDSNLVHPIASGRLIDVIKPTRFGSVGGTV